MNDMSHGRTISACSERATMEAGASKRPPAFLSSCSKQPQRQTPIRIDVAVKYARHRRLPSALRLSKRLFCFSCFSFACELCFPRPCLRAGVALPRRGILLQAEYWPVHCIRFAQPGPQPPRVRLPSLLTLSINIPLSPTRPP